MKKIIRQIMAFTLAVAMVFASVCVTTVSVQADDSDYVIDAEGTLIKYAGNGGTITIPSSVKVIGENVFKSNMSIYSVTIPKSVKEIKNGAFNSCTNLATVKFNSGLKTIEKSAFYGCSELKNIKLPNTLKSVGFEAFAGCQHITEITIPASVTSIDNYAFGFIYTGKYSAIPGFTITGSSKGAAKEYAEKHDFPFVNNDGMNVTIKSLRSTKKHSATITWKSEGGATSFQIQYSQHKNFIDKVTKTVKGKNKNSLTVDGFMSGTNYNFKVRGIKTVNGKKVYSAWTKVQTVKIK